MKKLIVITGGTRGIGKAIAFLFAQYAGFDVVTCSRKQENLDAFSKEFSEKFPGLNSFVFKTDLSDRKEVEVFCGKIKSLNRQVNVLVNNAGLFLPGSVLEEEEGVLEKLFTTNLASAYHVTRALAIPMREFRSGHIFSVCSTASIIPYINGGSYCISKFALLGFTKVLREELKKYNVKVTAVLPGATLTDSWNGVDLPADRFMPPEDVAEAIYVAWKMSDRTVVEEILIRPQLGDI